MCGQLCVVCARRLLLSLSYMISHQTGCNQSRINEKYRRKICTSYGYVKMQYLKASS